MNEGKVKARLMRGAQPGSIILTATEYSDIIRYKLSHIIIILYINLTYCSI